MLMFYEILPEDIQLLLKASSHNYFKTNLIPWYMPSLIKMQRVISILSYTNITMAIKNAFITLKWRDGTLATGTDNATFTTLK